jgi:DNA-directed RNA polymerase subunit M/transcription elongation factor TFIIS
MKFCPLCRNYLYHDVEPNVLTYLCRNCGYKEQDEKGGLILEMNVQQRASEGYKILLNEFTKYDPTLPHIRSIKCPNEVCATNKGTQEKDVIYMKYDPVNLKYIYICNVCDQQWRSRTS